MLDCIITIATFALIPLVYREARAFLEWANETPQEASERHRLRAWPKR